MLITRVQARKVQVPLEKPFVISLGAITCCETVFVKLETDSGLIGYGEGAGLTFVTGETNDTVLQAIELFEQVLVGKSPYCIDEIHRQMDATLTRNGSAKAAIDLALYDLMAKGANLPLYRYLGALSGKVEIDMTIGLDKPERMAEDAARLVSEGYTALKIKAGSDEAQDIEAIRLIRNAAPAAHLKVDANQAWTVSQAKRMLEVYAKIGVEAVEQPVVHWNLQGLAQVREHAPIPVMADESCFTPQDAFKIASMGAADMINIKLMKCGGIYRALQINAIAEAAGIRCMLGCMLESRLSIAAGAALVASNRNFVQADLDSFLEFSDNSMIRTGFSFTAPYITLSEKPGIGEELDF